MRRRIEAGLDHRPLSWLAERTGDAYKNVQRWVRGKPDGDTPPYDFLARAADALGVTLDWLIAERGSPAGQPAPDLPDDMRDRMDELIHLWKPYLGPKGKTGKEPPPASE